MRYDDYNDFDPRSPRGNSKKGTQDYPRQDRGGQGRDQNNRTAYDRSRSYYQSQDFDRSRGYDRGGDFDRSRGYDRGVDFDRSRSYNRNDDFDRRDPYRDDHYTNERYNTRLYRSGRGEEDFDLSAWERTAPDWQNRDLPRQRRNTSRGESSRQDPNIRRENIRNRQQNEERSPRKSTQDPRGRAERRPSSGQQLPREQRRNRRTHSERPPQRHRPEEKRSPLRYIPIILSIAILVAAALIIRSCVAGNGKGNYDISFSTQSIVVGETAQATVTGIPDGESPVITWMSSDTNIVTVDGTGLLSAKSEGTATIAANIDGSVSVSGTVMVIKTAVGVESITLNAETATITSGDTYTIKATVNMEQGLAPAKVTWTSNDASVARVDEYGVVTARDVGTTIITATAGEKTAECVITVEEDPNAEVHDETQTTGEAPEEGTTTETTTGTGGTTTTTQPPTTAGTAADENLGSDITGTTTVNEDATTPPATENATTPATGDTTTPANEGTTTTE